MKYVTDLKKVNLSSIALVGGKNASTGEMIQNLVKMGIRTPGGFATTTEAFNLFLSQNHLDRDISKLIAKVKSANIKTLNKISALIQRKIMSTPFLPEFEAEISSAYKKLRQPAVAVRSSATTEDLASASFAGAQKTFLNVRGLKNLLRAVKLVYASLYTARAIAYRYDKRFDDVHSAISVGVQPMIRSDKGASGVIFTIDTESGFDKVIIINATYGLGEAIVQGSVNPDEFIVSKPLLEEGRFAILQRKLGEKALKMIYTADSNPEKSIKSAIVPKKDQLRFCITDREIERLAKQALIIEKHYGKPMDIEWAKDGLNGQLYILQARPETVVSQMNREQGIERYALAGKGEVLSRGQSIGQRIGKGRARVISDPKKMHAVKPGDVLVTDMTDPDWEPIMKTASAIVTNRGGRTCHAAIIARELGVPAVVGCGDATRMIKDNRNVTVSCAEGEIGYVYSGDIPYTIKKVTVKDMPKIPVKLCMNIGNPEKAFINRFLPNHGVGLARLEFIIGTMIGIHPNAVIAHKKLKGSVRQAIADKTAAYKNPVEFYIEKLREGIAVISAAFYPQDVIFRFSDFKSNEYANLLGGDLFEPLEENPMIGFRGASRYRDKKFIKCFELECMAFKRVRDQMGLVNAQLMIPFVRTVEELRDVMTLIASYGLKRGENGLKIYMMCEIPSNVLLASEFLKQVDGFSIGSNDLTQLTLGLDRDSSLVSNLFDERDASVKALLHQAISECNKQGKYIGICGQGPSDHPDFAAWLMHEGIQCMSLNPDTIIETWLMLAEKNRQ
ncbi:Phosphoenolpyruvate synthase [Aquicella siphonis]|uniref:Phosphoenolpyruvate synthase n=1 Tax=Aquicella siphonis TaxID=254247 RepID=A0A5E4PJQ5_9COXI|nr:phosphoenolpyruvate synthase [Aquicella siphonis]VVC77204.1 Phosphoenolpyruvate synthase [Aquicella siphonis]